jgi:hypothetical protein
MDWQRDFAKICDTYVLEARQRLSEMQNIVHENVVGSQAKQK